MSVEMMEGGQGHEVHERSKKAPSPLKTAIYVFSVAVVAAVIAIVFNFLFQPDELLSDAKGLDKFAHTVIAIVLGIYLVARLCVAVYHYAQAKAAVGAFYSACVTIAISSTHVQEALTISAGAEHEKKGIAYFRAELARLLGFSARCFNHAIRGETVVKDSALMKVEEMLMISAKPHAPTPTLFATKLVAKLIAQQREAGRLDSALVAEFNSQVGDMVRAFNTITTLQKMPIPASVHEFATAWLFAFGLTLPVVLSYYAYSTPWVAPCASLFTVAFYFALNEVASQLEDLATVFTFDVSLAEVERQLHVDLQTFASGVTSSGEGML